MRRLTWLVGCAMLVLSSTATAEDATYTYDSLGRVASVTYVDGSTTYIIVYSYDAAGNRTQVVNQASANSVPVAVSDSVSASAGTPLTFDPRTNDSDPNGDAITISAKTDPAHGTVAINSGTSLTYTATSGYNGSDSFTYTISDGRGGFANGAVTATVTASNQAPIAINDSQIALKNTTLTFDPRGNDSDPNGDALTITAKSTPSHGALTIVSSGTQLSYVPTTNYLGSDSFTYTISDGRGGTATATVSMFVNGVPVVVNDTQVAQKGTPITFDPRTNDSDPNSDTLTITARSTPTNGAVTIGGGGTSVTYSPASGYSGADSFTYTVSDGRGSTATGTVTMSVNAPPVAVTDTKTTAVNTVVSFDPRTNDTDSDGDTLTVTAKTNGANGTVSFTSSSLSYTPNASFTGSDSFTYTISDGRGGTAVGAVNVTVGGNHAPVAVDDSAEADAFYAGGSWVHPSVTFDPRANDTDADSDTLTITGKTNGTYGTVTFNGTSLTYTYTTQYHPTGMDAELVNNDSFTYTISDGHGGTSTATVYVDVVVW